MIEMSNQDNQKKDEQEKKNPNGFRNEQEERRWMDMVQRECTKQWMNRFKQYAKDGTSPGEI